VEKDEQNKTRGDIKKIYCFMISKKKIKREERRTTAEKGRDNCI